jgi:hypothetical protein
MRRRRTSVHSRRIFFFLPLLLKAFDYWTTQSFPALLLLERGMHSSFLQETPDHRLDGWHMLMIIMKIKQKTDKLWLVDKKIINVQKRSPPQILFFTGGG